ncbi:hypothetical protein M231_04465 [Tremella mesenterica]|uniref:CID domain-containing protein n=1 Tax=Tremella mesenterica TaxID=5217 RepID=A0A4Q1BKZ4_TREME|nr:hypothetical protein M231_04465 [Tremella mesenterica]
MSYGAYPHYANPPPPPPPFYPPPPVVDPFRAYYADRLRELTFNSRPIIQDLSMLASAQRDAGDWTKMQAVVEEIENAVLRAPPQGKLPLLYLLDSISKNCGAPYTTDLLPPIIPRLYMRTYREVDGVTKSKMEEMVTLWRSSGPGRTDLYGLAVRDAVERDIFGSAGWQPPSRQYPTQHAVQQLLAQTMEGKQREVAARPWDPQPGQQINILLQLGQLLTTSTVPPPELQNIHDQLLAMQAAARQQPPPPPPPPPRPPIPPPIAQPVNTWTPPAPIQPAPGIHTPLPPFAPTLLPPNPAYPPRPQSSFVPEPRSSTPMIAPAPLPATTPSIPNFTMPLDVANILKNLNTAALLSKPQTPLLEVKPRNVLDEYEDLILSMKDVNLQNLDLTVSLPEREIPLDHLPERCKQCGLRFPGIGTQMQEHLDWHFRRNRKERETEGRGAHRRWLPRAEEWVSDLMTNNAVASGSGQSTAGPSNVTGVKTEEGKGKLTAEKMAQLKKRWVAVPSDPALAAKPCPICKETFKGEWSEEEEEWVFKNALNVNGNIYHATCRAEQMSAVVAARLMDGGRRTGSKSPRLSLTPGTEDGIRTPTSGLRNLTLPNPDSPKKPTTNHVEVMQDVAMKHEQQNSPKISPPLSITSKSPVVESKGEFEVQTLVDVLGDRANDDVEQSSLGGKHEAGSLVEGDNKRKLSCVKGTDDQEHVVKVEKDILEDHVNEGNDGNNRDDRNEINGTDATKGIDLNIETSKRKAEDEVEVEDVKKPKLEIDSDFEFDLEILEQDPGLELDMAGVVE